MKEGLKSDITKLMDNTITYIIWLFIFIAVLLSFFINTEASAMGYFIDKDDDAIEENVNGNGIIQEQRSTEIIQEENFNCRMQDLKNQMEERILDLTNHISILQHDLNLKITRLKSVNDHLERNIFRIISNEQARRYILESKAYPSDNFTSFLLSDRSPNKMKFKDAINYCRVKTDGYPQGSWTMITKTIFSSDKFSSYENENVDNEPEWYIQRNPLYLHSTTSGIRRFNNGRVFFDPNFTVNETAFVRCVYYTSIP